MNGQRVYPGLHLYPLLARAPTPLAPPSDLLPETYAARLYRMLGPLTQWDESAAWSLLILCNAIGTGLGFQIVEDVVRDTEDGPGWSIVMDVDRCPPVALDWLGQFVGVRLPPGLTEDEQRAWIKSTDGFRRGTRAAMTGALAPTLTGKQRVDFRERSGGPFPAPQTYGQVKTTYATYAAMTAAYPTYQSFADTSYAYYLEVSTYASETPDPAASLRALLSQKPGGIVLDYSTVTGQSYAQVKSRFATYAALKAAYPDYLSVKQDEP